MRNFSGFWLALAFILALGTVSAVTAQNFKGSKAEYQVVINHEEQYSVWPAHKPLQTGWKSAGFTGSQAACREYIEEVWTDMRPLSVRKMKLSADTRYTVIINHEEQYSVWPAGVALPQGWKATPKTGSLNQCREYIEEVWTDMRPLSIRKMQVPGKH